MPELLGVFVHSFIHLFTSSIVYFYLFIIIIIFFLYDLKFIQGAETSVNLKLPRTLIFLCKR